MVEQNQAQDMISALLADFNTKLRDVEERQRLMKDRVLLISQNLVNEKDETSEILIEIKKTLETLKVDVYRTKETVKRILEEMENYARKSDLEILQRQSKMFQPLELARISDVEKMIKDLKHGN